MINLEKQPRSTSDIFTLMKNVFMAMSGAHAMSYIRRVYKDQDGLTVLYVSWGTEHPNIDQSELRELLGADQYDKVRNVQLHTPV